MGKIKKDTTFIYALRDPETGDVFYVGKSDDPRKRLSNHIHATRRFFDIPPLNLRIKEMFDKNTEPQLIVLDEVKIEEWEQKEQFYIAQHQDRGLELLNLTRGGKTFGQECLKNNIRQRQRPVIQYDLKGNYIQEYVSIKEASIKMNCGKSTIYCSLNTKHRTALGFYWRFKLSNTVAGGHIDIIKPYSYTTKNVFMMLPNGEKKVWTSIREAAKELGLNETQVSCAIRRNTRVSGYKIERDMTCKRWHHPHGKLNQKLVNYAYIDPSEYPQFNK